jgi:hypothetical protein
MSDPPPRPVVSPDGKLYWDGQHWVPVQRSTTANPPVARSFPAAAIVVIVVLGLGVIGGLVWYTHQTCTVGYAGTDLQVTAEGQSAPGFCQQFLDSNSGHGYAVDQPDQTGTLICRYSLNDGTTVTVRDKGILKLYGAAECQQLAQQAGDQTLPSPST